MLGDTQIAPPEDVSVAADASAIEAAQTIAEVLRVLQKSGTNLVAEILPKDGVFETWMHLPDGDAIDVETGSQYYYHSHAVSEDHDGPHDDEHGHFHLFRRVTNAEGEVALYPLIGIAMDRYGRPFRLFTTNRWVTGTDWADAEVTSQLLEGFEVDITQPSWPLNLWLSAMVRLYRAEIDEALIARDNAISAWAERFPDRDTYEDRDLEVTSAVSIDLGRRLEQLLGD